MKRIFQRMNTAERSFIAISASALILQIPKLIDLFTTPWEAWTLNSYITLGGNFCSVMVIILTIRSFLRRVKKTA